MALKFWIDTDVVRDNGLSFREISVLGYLCKRGASRQFVSVSKGDIADGAACALGSVRGIVAMLTALGLVTVERRTANDDGRLPNRYRVCRSIVKETRVRA